MVEGQERARLLVVVSPERLEVEQGWVAPGEREVHAEARRGIHPRLDDAVRSLRVDFPAAVLEHSLKRHVPLYPRVLPRRREARGEAEGERLLSAVLAEDEALPVDPRVEEDAGCLPHHLHARFGVAAQVQFLVVERSRERVVRLAVERADDHLQVARRLDLGTEHRHCVEAVLRVAAAPRGYFAVVEVGVFLRSPEVEQVRPELHLHRVQRLVREGGVNPHARERVALDEWAFVLVVEQKRHALHAQPQFPAFGRVQLELLRAVDQGVELGVERKREEKEEEGEEERGGVGHESVRQSG